MGFEVKGNQITLTAPNSFTLKLIQDRFLPEITKRAEAFLSGPPSFELRIGKKNSALTAKKSPATKIDVVQPIPK